MAPVWVNHAGMPADMVITEPERHALVMPGDCDCGMCAPTWARRRGKSRRFTEPVTLADALTRESPAARPSMIASTALACRRWHPPSARNRRGG